MNYEPSAEQWLEIGTIVGTQGLKGEVRVVPSSDFPERFLEPGQRWLRCDPQAQPQPIELLGGYQIPGKKLYVLKLAGVTGRDRAEALRGCQLLVDRRDRPQLAQDEYHVADLIGLEVYHQLTGENLGVVTDILWAGHDLLEVTLHQQPTPEATPATEASPTPPTRKKKRKKPKQQKPATVLIPFVKEIVPVVALEAGRCEIAPPPGLLELK